MGPKSIILKQKPTGMPGIWLSTILISQLDKMQTQVKDLKKEHRRENEKVIDDFQQQMSELEQQLGQKTHEVEIMQSELKQVKEFRRKRVQMQRELEEVSIDIGSSWGPVFMKAFLKLLVKVQVTSQICMARLTMHFTEQIGRNVRVT